MEAYCNDTSFSYDRKLILSFFLIFKGEFEQEYKMAKLPH